MATYLKHEIRATVQTTDATVTTCGSYTLPDATVVGIEVMLVAKTSGSADTAMWKFVSKAERAGGGATVATAVALQQIIDAGLGSATFGTDASSNDLRVRVTGIAATTIDWTAFITIYLYTP